MRNIKFIIQYDGSMYNGWQRLSVTKRTLQGRIEDILGGILEEKIKVIGCGRTDAGVHALNYVLNFHAYSTMEIDELIEKFRKNSPTDIQLLAAKNCSDRFHARYNALNKTYIYKIDNSELGDIFNRKYKYQVPSKLDLANMRACAEVLEGTHDFQSFTSLKTKKKSTIRKIFSIDIEMNDDTKEIQIKITGDGFLWHMVRIIVGTLIEAGLGEYKPTDIERILEDKKRSSAGIKAPPFALYLFNVNYSE